MVVVYAFVMAEDLYKAANRHEIVVDEWLFRYLDATAAALCHVLRQRGFTIHSLISNTFDTTFAGMQLPLELYGRWFQA